MNSIVYLMVLLFVVFWSGCSERLTSPDPVVGNSPSVPTLPSGPIQLAEMRGFNLDPFRPNQNNPGPSATFRKTVDDLDFRLELGTAGDYSFVVIVVNSRFGDGVNPTYNLSITPFSFQGTSGSVRVSYDSSKCYQGECWLYLSNRSDKAIERDNKNMARIFGTPEP